MNPILNEANVAHAISIMRRAAGMVLMTNFQTTPDGLEEEEALLEEAHLHNCGNKACFAGWVGVSDEFRESGGYVSENGIPVLEDPLTRIVYKAEGAIAKWLGISDELAQQMVYPDYGRCMGYHQLYGKRFIDVDHEDVIAVLERIQKRELH